MSEQPQVRTALMVGAGLLGTSLGMALVRVGWHVHLQDSSAAAVRLAAELGAGAATFPAVEPDVVVLAIPPSRISDVVAGLAQQFPSATFTDVASAKTVVQQHVDALKLGARFVGGHPMAGRERSGAQAARADLFEGRTWVLCPTTGVEAQRVALVAQMAKLTGAQVVSMSAAAHDEAVAKVSHVPQLLASVMAAQLLDIDAEELELAGQGLRDTVRIAASDPDLWADIIVTNAEAVRAALQGVADEVGELLNDLDGRISAKSINRVSDNQSGIHQTLARGREGHGRIPGKHGAPAVPYAVVPVVIPDEPGALARLFASAGQAGINIEDVRIEHSPGQPVGLVELLVAPEKAGELGEALGAMGWSVH